MRVVVSLLNESQLLSLALVESTLHTTHRAGVGEGRAKGRERRRGGRCGRRQGRKGRCREGEGTEERERGQEIGRGDRREGEEREMERGRRGGR